MQTIDNVFAALQTSSFRRRFRLGERERAYLDAKGLAVVMAHAADFVDKRLAPARPVNDGKQTPMRGHPVFLAQHATGTCCRGCLAKWHAIPAGRVLDTTETVHVLRAIERWLREQGAGS